MKTRTDKIRELLLSIEVCAYKARHLPAEQEQELMGNIRIIGAFCNELLIILNTDEQSGRGWGWWE